MSTLSAELTQAQPALRAAAEAEDTAVVAFARCTPALLREASALQQCLRWSLAAVESLRSELPHAHMVTADLRLMSAQVSVCSAQFAVLQHMHVSA